jgi:putative ABC transport system permease protein
MNRFAIVAKPLAALPAELRLAARRLAKAPGFTAVALLMLACAIGANTAIFSVVDGLLLRPLPLAGAERLMKLLRHLPELDLDALSVPKYFFWRDRGTASAGFAAIAAYESLGSGFNLVTDGRPERIVGSHVSANFFAVFADRPQLGRTFAAEEDRPGGPRAVVLSDRLWRRRFGGEPAVVGRRLRLNGELYTVVGVMPANFRFPARSELWTPWQLDPASDDKESYIEVAGRLRQGAGMAAAQAAMDVVARRFAAARPDHVRPREGIRVLPLQQYLYGPLRPALLVLLAAVGAVLLIACVNLANLQLARLAAQQREIAIRTALGASRWQVLRQLLAESLLLSFLGGAAGLLLGAWCLRPLLAASPVGADSLARVAVDGRVLLFTFGLSALSAVLFGLAPVMQRVGRRERERGGLPAALAEASGRTAGRRTGRLTRQLLVAAEVALAMVLAIAGMLLARSFVGLLRGAPGFSADHVLTLKLSLPQARYGNGAALDRFAAELVGRVAGLPAVSGAALASTLPLEDGPPMGFAIDGRYHGETSGDGFGIAQYRAVTPGYFRTLRIAGRRGRTFDAGDRRGAEPVAVINEAATRRYWPGRDPLGSRIILGVQTSLADPRPRRIVGIVDDVRERGLDEPPPPIAYVPMSQLPDAVAAAFVELLPTSLAVRTAGPAPGLAHAVERQVAAVDPQQPVTDVCAMEEIVARSLGPRRFAAVLLGALSLLALALAAVGIYGVLSYLVQQRGREIGVRMALGATGLDVLGMVVRQGMSAVSVGIAVGLAGAFALARLLGNLLYGVGPHDPSSFALTAAFLALVAAVACAVPARRASRLDPLSVLRE